MSIIIEVPDRLSSVIDGQQINAVAWHAPRLHRNTAGQDPIAYLSDTGESHETFAALLADCHDYPSPDFPDDLLM